MVGAQNAADTAKSIGKFLYSGIALIGFILIAFWLFRPRDNRGPWERYMDQTDSQVTMPTDPNARMFADQMRDSARKMAIENDRNGVPFIPGAAPSQSPGSPTPNPASGESLPNARHIGFGLGCYPIDTENANWFARVTSVPVGKVVGKVVYVSQVQPGGPAAVAGIQAGDFIYALDNQAFDGSLGLAAFVASKPEGYVASVSLIRKGADSSAKAYKFQVRVGMIQG